MQILILGMHRSGTSATARLINMMGAYFAPEGLALPANNDNPKGFWERRDVLKLNDALLAEQGCRWNEVAAWPFEPRPAPGKTAPALRNLVLNLDAHRPWLLKDPRLCLTLPHWRRFLELPVAVIVYRDPLEIAASLAKRNGMPLDYALALWEYYAVGILSSTRKIPRIFLYYDELLKTPVKACEALYKELAAFGVRRLEMPGQREIRIFIDPKLYRARPAAGGKLSATQSQLAAWLRGEKEAPEDLVVSENAQAIMKAGLPPRA